jgi:hypothetical protein
MTGDSMIECDGAKILIEDGIETSLRIEFEDYGVCRRFYDEIEKGLSSI